MAFLIFNLFNALSALRRSGPWAQKNCSQRIGSKPAFACPGLRRVLCGGRPRAPSSILSPSYRAVRRFFLCTSFFQQVPFLGRAAAATWPNSHHTAGHFITVAVFFFALYSTTRSRLGPQQHKQFLYQRAGCDFFLCRTYCSQRSMLELRKSLVCPPPHWPLFFPMSYTFYGAGCNHFNVPLSVSLFWQPAEGRYRDNH